MGERAVFAIHAHVFQIDPKTKKKWIPSSSSAVRVAFYHDPSRGTYRIIAIETNKALINSTITANMNFTKTSPKFGQWSDHRANTVYGLGFSAEKDLVQFVEKFNEAKTAAKELANERQLAAKRHQDQEKTLPPAAAMGGSSPSPTSPHIKSPSLISPPASTGSMTSKSPSPLQSSPGPEIIDTIETSEHSSISSTSSKEGVMDGGLEVQLRGEQAERKISAASSGGSSPLINGGESPHIESLHPPHRVTTNGHSTESLDTQLESLKHENSRLKMALATSTTNVKKWESEMQTLKKNNDRLTMALEESSQHVAQWKLQLHKYKEENDSLKLKIKELEVQGRERRNEATEAVQRENEELKEVLSAVQIDLESKTEELQQRTTDAISLEQEIEELTSKLQGVEDDNETLNSQISLLEDQLKMASVASKRKVEGVEIKHKELGEKLQELLRLHKDIATDLVA